MAVFYNQATLRYRGGVTNSNLVTGELTQTAGMVKTAVSAGYAQNETVTYALSIVNDGDAALDALQITDDLGGYPFAVETVYPLAYKEGSLRCYVNGVLLPEDALTVLPGPPFTVTGLGVPAGGSAVLVYEAAVTAYAPLGEGAVIENTATAAGSGVYLTAAATLPAANAPALTVTKAMDPETVSANERITYTFVLRNAGAQTQAADAVVLSDTFDPRLTDLTVAVNGDAKAADVDYTYDETTGAFATVAGGIAVPGASYEQSETGEWIVTPGVSVLTVEGTVAP